ncbi:MAG: DUF6282 family protein [Caldilineaceae bacterium]
MREGRMVDGRFVPLSELYPKFKHEELDRCIRIPVDEKPGPELDEILHLIADHPHVYLNTGHVSVPEAMRLVDLAQEYGIEKVLVASSVTKIASMAELRRMADQGAFIEYTLAVYTHTTPIPKTHYYVEREYVSIDEGMSEGPGGASARPPSRSTRSAPSTASSPRIWASIRCPSRWRGCVSSSPVSFRSRSRRKRFARWSPPILPASWAWTWSRVRVASTGGQAIGAGHAVHAHWGERGPFCVPLAQYP